VTFKPLKPLNDLIVLTDSFDHLMDPEVSYPVKTDDFIAIELTDTTPIANVMQRLKTRFPRIIELHRVNQLDVTPETLNIEEVQRDPLTLLDDFFKTVTEHPLTTQQEDWAKQTLQQAMKEED
jgi:exonuclease SbcD